MFSKAGIPPADAIAQICQPAATLCGDCYIAASLCVWWGQYQALGATAFNTKWTATGLSTGFIDPNPPTAWAAQMISPAGDGIQVPGDWECMQNYNYKSVLNFVDAKGNCPYYQICVAYRKKAAQALHIAVNLAFDWNVENAFLIKAVGGHGFAGDLYEGYAVAPCTKLEMQKTLIDAYNTDMAPLFPMGINVNGAVRELSPANPSDLDLMHWYWPARIHN